MLLIKANSKSLGSVVATVGSLGTIYSSTAVSEGKQNTEEKNKNLATDYLLKADQLEREKAYNESLTKQLEVTQQQLKVNQGELLTRLSQVEQNTSKNIIEEITGNVVFMTIGVLISIPSFLAFHGGKPNCRWKNKKNSLKTKLAHQMKTQTMG